MSSRDSEADPVGTERHRARSIIGEEWRTIGCAGERVAYLCVIATRNHQTLAIGTERGVVHPLFHLQRRTCSLACKHVPNSRSLFNRCNQPAIVRTKAEKAELRYC